jgi:hypothetical protein
LSEEPVFRGVSRPRWRQRRSPSALPGPRSARVVEHPLVEGVADVAFERAQRARAGHSFGAFALVVGVAFAAAVTDLAYRRYLLGVQAALRDDSGAEPDR